MILLVVLAVLSPMENALAARDFGAAYAMADCDSLRAVVLLEAGWGGLAAVHALHALGGDCSAGVLALLWEAVAMDAAGAAPAPPGACRLLRESLAGCPPPEPSALASLAGSARALGDSALADSLEMLVLTGYPGTVEASGILSGLFWDRLYPVWSDDSARMAELRGFISETGRFSAFWRTRARQYLMSALLETADSVSWRRELEIWLADCPGDPVPCLAGAALMIERDSAWDEAAALASEGLGYLSSGWTPAGLPPGESALMLPALGSDLRFRRAQALLMAGRTEECRMALDSAFQLSCSDVDDYHTTASLHWLAGRLALAEGDTATAVGRLLEACIAGDPDSRWTGLSTATLDSLGLADPAAEGRARAGYAGPVFEDATNLLREGEVAGGRVSWCDFDVDGWPDLLLGGRLYRNVLGTGFEDVTASVGLEELGSFEGVFGDLDGDGRPDLVTSGRSPRIIMNRPGGFSDETGAGISGPEASAEGVGLLDWDADGRLDIYLAFYEHPGGLGEGTPDAFLLQGTDGSFSRAEDDLGMHTLPDVPLCGRGVSPCDFDRDGDVDIFVSDYRLQENLLWENTPAGASCSAAGLGLAGEETDGWWGHTIGSAWADFDNDSDWDLFSANLAHPRYIDFSDRSMLLVSEDGRFTDERAARGIRFEETHSVPVWGDFDLDGLLDLYLTSVYEGRRSFLYRQLPGGGFEDVTFLSGTRLLNGWGAAVADFDRDGRLDLAVGSGSGSRLFRNVTPGGHWLLVEVDPPSGASPLGAVVEVEQDGVAMLRQVSGGSGTTCQDEAVLHFGLPGGGPVTWRLWLPGSTEPLSGTTPADVLVSVP